MKYVHTHRPIHAVRYAQRITVMSVAAFGLSNERRRFDESRRLQA